MKNLLLFFLSAFILSSCSPSSYCTSKKNYLSKIDTTRPFFLKGKYCIESISPHQYAGDSVLVHFNMYFRISGKIVPNGIVIFNSLEDKVLITNGIAEKKSRPGKCDISISSINSLPFRIRNIDFKPNTIYTINVFLGDSLQE